MPKRSPTAATDAAVVTEVQRAMDEQQAVLARGLGTGGKAFVLFCARSVQVWLTSNAMQMAAAVAFYSFFSLFPMSLLIIFAFDLFAESDALQQQHLARALGAFIPVSQDTIASSIQTAAGSKATSGPLALAGLVWASTAAFATLRKGINTSWSMHVPRPFLKERLIDLTATAGAGILFLLLLISTSAIRTVADGTSTTIGIFAAPTWLALPSFLITFGAFSFLYWFLPNRRVRYRDVLFGAFVAALAFEIAKGAFFLYTQTRANVDIIYGPWTGLAVLLGWLYTSAVILLIGALVAAIYSRLVALSICSHADIWSFAVVPGLRILRRRIRAHLQRELPVA